MTVLTLQPGINLLDYELFATGSTVPSLSGRDREYRNLAEDAPVPAESLRRLTDGTMPDAIAVRIAFGGTDFARPTIATPRVVARLEALIALAPLHLPAAVALIRGCAGAFPKVPIVLAFDTGFFAQLPAREANYGIGSETADKLGVRRFGYHGIYHQAATAQASRRLAEIRGPSASSRVISICLEPQPEMVATVDGRPIAVTGGATPLEGLPGETTSGEIDPSIVLELADKRGWGPERIDYTLTRESGLSALAGRHITVGEALSATGPRLDAPGRQLRYRILLGAGAGLAALGGLDAIVFSGRYRSAGESLGPWLVRHCVFPGGNMGTKIPCYYLDKSLSRLLADTAEEAVSRVPPIARLLRRLLPERI